MVIAEVMVIAIVTMSIVVVVSIIVVGTMVTSMASSCSILIFVLVVIVSFLDMMRCMVLWNVMNWLVVYRFVMLVPSLMISR